MRSENMEAGNLDAILAEAKHGHLWLLPSTATTTIYRVAREKWDAAIIRWKAALDFAGRGDLEGWKCAAYCGRVAGVGLFWLPEWGNSSTEARAWRAWQALAEQKKEIVK